MNGHWSVCGLLDPALSCCWPWLRMSPGLEHTPWVTPASLPNSPLCLRAPLETLPGFAQLARQDSQSLTLGGSRPWSLPVLLGVKGISGFSQRVELLEQGQALW